MAADTAGAGAGGGAPQGGTRNPLFAVGAGIATAVAGFTVYCFSGDVYEKKVAFPNVAAQEKGSGARGTVASAVERARKFPNRAELIDDSIAMTKERLLRPEERLERTDREREDDIVAAVAGDTEHEEAPQPRGARMRRLREAAGAWNPMRRSAMDDGDTAPSYDLADSANYAATRLQSIENNYAVPRPLPDAPRQTPVVVKRTRVEPRKQPAGPPATSETDAESDVLYEEAPGPKRVPVALTEEHMREARRIVAQRNDTFRAKDLANSEGGFWERARHVLFGAKINSAAANRDFQLDINRDLSTIAARTGRTEEGAKDFSNIMRRHGHDLAEAGIGQSGRTRESWEKRAAQQKERSRIITEAREGTYSIVGHTEVQLPPTQRLGVPGSEREARRIAAAGNKETRGEAASSVWRDQYMNVSVHDRGQPHRRELEYAGVPDSAGLSWRDDRMNVMVHEQEIHYPGTQEVLERTDRLEAESKPIPSWIGDRNAHLLQGFRLTGRECGNEQTNSAAAPGEVKHDISPLTSPVQARVYAKKEDITKADNLGLDGGARASRDGQAMMDYAKHIAALP